MTSYHSPPDIPIETVHRPKFSTDSDPIREKPPINNQAESSEPAQSQPLLNRKMFHPPNPEPSPISIPTPFQPRRSTRRNLGQAPVLLDPSNHLLTEHTQITDYLLAPTNTSPIQHYCAMLDIKLPSGNYVY